MPFTPEEKARIKYHLSYPLAGTHDALLSHGLTIPTPIVNELEHALDAVLPAAEKIVRIDIVPRLECILKQIDQARSALLVLKTGSTELNPAAIPMLRREYSIERGRLADSLGIDKYHWSYLTTDEGGYVSEPC